MMILLDRFNRVIGSYVPPVTTDVTISQIGRYRDMGDIEPMELHRIEVNGIHILRIRGETPKDLFSHEEFLPWIGHGR